jgi:hypothetical protein
VLFFTVFNGYGVDSAFVLSVSLTQSCGLEIAVISVREDLYALFCWKFPTRWIHQDLLWPGNARKG